MQEIGYLETEALVFLLLRKGGHANLREISLCTNNASRRSVSRYLKDLRDCGALEKSWCDRRAQEYIVDRGLWDRELSGMGRRDIHLRRLARITWLLDSGTLEDERLTAKDLTSIYEKSDVSYLWGDLPSKRSIQRDLATARRIRSIFEERNR